MRRTIAILFLAIATLNAPTILEAADAGEIVRAAWEYWRGETSTGQMSMTIHRPDWERSMSMRMWSRGQKESLVRVVLPKKDAGNATLMLDNGMWSFSPKVNRVIKVPSSMMSQSWMGSDFSNKDVSRADDIVDQYTHTLLGERNEDGRSIFEIESVPNEDSAVVWGKEVLTIRDDYLILTHRFFDQDGVLVKTLQTLEIAEMGGRTVAQRQRMQKAEAEDEWTEISVDAVEYDVDLSDTLFTLSNLRNPRD